MKTWLTSDTHFNHLNIIRYCDRPFHDINHMNEELISRWNSRVSPDDIVYHVGDMAMGDKSQIPIIRKRLNGKIILIAGNHDHRHNGRDLLEQIKSAGFDEIHQELNTIIDGVRVWIRHEPKMDWVPSADAEYHLCGHVHSSWNRRGNIINVGVDVHDYAPVSLAEAIAKPEIAGKSHRGY